MEKTQQSKQCYCQRGDNSRERKLFLKIWVPLEKLKTCYLQTTTQNTIKEKLKINKALQEIYTY